MNCADASFGFTAGEDSAVDVKPPDSRLARHAEELVRTSCLDFLTNYCIRSFAWSVALGARDHIRFDAELLYVAALLHDLGLIAKFDTGRCFEEDSAAVAKDLAAAENWTDERRDALAEAIRLHNAVDIALEDGPEAYLLWHATGLDVTGHRHGELAAELVEKVTTDYPRLEFKRGFTDLILDQAGRKPNCWAARVVEAGSEGGSRPHRLPRDEARSSGLAPAESRVRLEPLAVRSPRLPKVRRRQPLAARRRLVAARGVTPIAGPGLPGIIYSPRGAGGPL